MLIYVTTEVFYVFLFGSFDLLQLNLKEKKIVKNSLIGRLNEMSISKRPKISDKERL